MIKLTLLNLILITSVLMTSAYAAGKPICERHIAVKEIIENQMGIDCGEIKVEQLKKHFSKLNLHNKDFTGLSSEDLLDFPSYVTISINSATNFDLKVLKGISHNTLIIKNMILKDTALDLSSLSKKLRNLNIANTNIEKVKISDDNSIPIVVFKIDNTPLRQLDTLKGNQFPSLKYISLTNTNLIDLSLSGEFNLLQRLLLSRNKLKKMKLPESANQLEILDLSHNNLDKFDHIVTYPKFKVLVLNNNKLSTLKDCIFQADKMNHIYLNGNVDLEIYSTNFCKIPKTTLVYVETSTYRRLSAIGRKKIRKKVDMYKW